MDVRVEVSQRLHLEVSHEPPTEAALERSIGTTTIVRALSGTPRGLVQPHGSRRGGTSAVTRRCTSEDASSLEGIRVSSAASTRVSCPGPPTYARRGRTTGSMVRAPIRGEPERSGVGGTEAPDPVGTG